MVCGKLAWASRYRQIEIMSISRMTLRIPNRKHCVLSSDAISIDAPTIEALLPAVMIHASQQYENAAAVIDNGQPGLASGLTGFGVFGAGLHPEMLDSGSDSFVDDLASYRGRCDNRQRLRYRREGGNRRIGCVALYLTARRI